MQLPVLFEIALKSSNKFKPYGATTTPLVHFNVTYHGKAIMWVVSVVKTQ